MDQAQVREGIAEIRSNNNLSANEKADRIRQLLSGQTIGRSASNENNNSSRDNLSLSCNHYPNKKCSRLLFSCCNVRYPCHRCHNEQKVLCQETKYNITDLVCNECNRNQTSSMNCAQCGIPFGKNYCSTCILWTDADIVHCDKCGLCRVGKPGSLFHCDDCDGCYSIETRNTHTCSKYKMRDEKCPYCLELLFSSQQCSTVLKCGHVCHLNCLNTAIKSDIYTCPTCRKSVCSQTKRWDFMRELIFLTPMPTNWPLKSSQILESVYGRVMIESREGDGSIQSEMYIGHLIDWTLADKKHPRVAMNRSSLHNPKVYIFCCDCEHTTLSNYHELGIECSDCGGFNTTLTTRR